MSQADVLVHVEDPDDRALIEWTFTYAFWAHLLSDQCLGTFIDARAHLKESIQKEWALNDTNVWKHGSHFAAAVADGRISDPLSVRLAKHVAWDNDHTVTLVAAHPVTKEELSEIEEEASHQFHRLCEGVERI